MANTAIHQYRAAISKDWAYINDDLNDNFSLATVARASASHGYDISDRDWQAYYSSLPLSKSRLRYMHPGSDNELAELTEVEIDYVVGGAAALPVAAVVIVVVTFAIVAVTAAAATVSVIAAAVTGTVYAMTSLWGGGGDDGMA